MGHLHRVRQGIRSTNEKKPPLQELMDEETSPKKEIKLDPPRRITNWEHLVGVDVIPYQELTGKISTDQAGKFPITTQQGNAYIMVLYDFDSNSIHATPIKSRLKGDLVKGYQTMYNELIRAGIRPILHQLDNECPQEMIIAIIANGTKYQLAPPGDHKTNREERAVQTFKNHFISTLFGADSKFPANQWDRLITQAVMTLNMLLPSRINPKLSAYNQIWVNFNFNTTPLAPPGCRVVVHESPESRRTWASHGVQGFYYCEPAMNHYRNYKCYIPETNGMRLGKTVEFFPKHVQMPQTSSEDRLSAAIENITNILQNPHSATPLLKEGTPNNDAISKL
jgi:hypothetical protein